MTDINYFSILPTLTVYEHRRDGTDRTAYIVSGEDEALAFARVLVSNGSTVEITPAGIGIPTEEFVEIERDFDVDGGGSTEGPDCQCADPTCPCKNPVNTDRDPEDITAQALSNTTDGYAWAYAFVRTLQGQDVDPDDVDWIQTWFANAIELGRREGERSKNQFERERDEDRHQGLSDPLG